MEERPEMKPYILAAIVLSTALMGCAHNSTIPAEQLVVQKVVEAPGLSKEQIFEMSKIWIARTFLQPAGGFAADNWPRTVIQYEDEGKGTLVASSSILYPFRNYSADTYKEGWEVRFIMAEDVKDGKALLTFSNLVMYVPTTICGYYSNNFTKSYQKELTADEMEKVKPIFLSLPDRLESFLKDEKRGEW
jgi:hypothetical protein